MRRDELNAVIRLAEIVKALAVNTQDHELYAETTRVLVVLESIIPDDCGE